MRGLVGGIEGSGGRWLKNCKELFRAGKATKSNHKVPIPHYKTKEVSSYSWFAFTVQSPFL